MTHFRRRFLGRAFEVLDLLVLCCSFLVAAIQVWDLTAPGSFTSFISMRVKVANLLLLFGLFYSWHLICHACGLYGSKLLRDPKQDLGVLKATSGATAFLVLAALVFKVHMVTAAFLVLFWALSSVGLMLCRSLARAYVASMRKGGRNMRYILIVGTNSRAEVFAESLEARPALGYQLLGFADDEWEGNRHFGTNGKTIVTSLDQFSQFLREHIVDEVVIALPMKSFYSHTARIVSECREQGVIVRGLTNLFDCPPSRRSVSDFDAMQLFTHSNQLFEGAPAICKRLLDFLAALTLVVLLAPLLLVVALLVRLDSPGPAIFVQERVGLNKRKFRMYKFRTMVADAEKKQIDLEKLNEADGPVFKIQRDPRITRIGKYLRKASIDELPQLLNILKGDMSLVGPRPLPIRDYRGFGEGWLHRRFSVRPGITCLWQVKGRSSITFGRWMELDLQYVDNWSFWLDLKILAETVPAVLVGRGAV